MMQNHAHSQHQSSGMPAAVSSSAVAVPPQALALHYVYGLSQNVIFGVHDLTDAQRKAVFYVAGHTGVIYDYTTGVQVLLQGHTNAIRAVAVSADKRWIVTADTGEDCMLVVWDSIAGVPVRTYFNPAPGGITAVDISGDSMFIAALSDSLPQQMIILEWTTVSDSDEANDAASAAAAGGGGGADGAAAEVTPPGEFRHWIPSGLVPGNRAAGKSSSPRRHRSTVGGGGGGDLDDDDDAEVDGNEVADDFEGVEDEEELLHVSIRFHRQDSRLLVTNSKRQVVFWNLRGSTCRFHVPSIRKGDMKHVVGRFAQTMFVPNSTLAVSSTADGDVLLWSIVKKDLLADSGGVAGGDDGAGDDGNHANADDGKGVEELDDIYPLPGFEDVPVRIFRNREHIKRPVKCVRLHTGPISVLTSVLDRFIVTGGQDGHVRYFDALLRIVAWFEDIHQGPITSLSFAASFDPTPFGPTAAAAAGFGFNAAGGAGGSGAGGGSQVSAIGGPTQPGWSSSISPNPAGGASSSYEQQFISPNFIVATSHGSIVGVDATSFLRISGDESSCTMLLEGYGASVTGLCVHPNRSEMIVCDLSGTVRIVDYVDHIVKHRAHFKGLLANSIQVEPSGKYIVVGFTNGIVKVLHGDSLEELQHFEFSDDAITRIVFSPDGSYFATADAKLCVGIYKYTNRDEDARKPLEWVHIGKYRSHLKPIVGLEFYVSGGGLSMPGDDFPATNSMMPGSRGGVGGRGSSALLMHNHGNINNGNETSGRMQLSELYGGGPGGGLMKRYGDLELLSVGADRQVVEYDLSVSSVTQGVQLKRVTNIEQYVSPTAQCVVNISDDEMHLVVANAQFKLKQHLMTPDQKICCKVALGPNYGGPIHHLVPVLFPTSSTSSSTGNPATPNPMGPSSERPVVASMLAYAARDKIAGLIQMPFHGAPHSHMGLVAHCGPIAAIAVSHDGALLFTAGDHTVNSWEINANYFNLVAHSIPAVTDIVRVSPTADYAAVGAGNDASQIQLPPASAGSSAFNSRTTTPAVGADAASSMLGGGMDPNSNAAAVCRVDVGPFLPLVEGGLYGTFMNEMVDFFYYVQLRSLQQPSESDPTPVRVEGLVACEDVPTLCRALGFFPTERDVEAMINELRYEYGAAVAKINFQQFLKLFVNHRPAVGLTVADAEDAFAALGADPIHFLLKRQTLFSKLRHHGERMTDVEIEACVTRLLNDPNGMDAISDEISAPSFLSEILGFEEFDVYDSSEGLEEPAESVEVRSAPAAAQNRPAANVAGTSRPANAPAPSSGAKKSAGSKLSSKSPSSASITATGSTGSASASGKPKTGSVTGSSAASSSRPLASKPAASGLAKSKLSASTASSSGSSGKLSMTGVSGKSIRK